MTGVQTCALPIFETSPLSIADQDDFPPDACPGTPVLDCPLTTPEGVPAWLTDQVGDAFTLLIYGAPRSEDHVLAEHLSGIFPTRVLRIVAATDAPGKSGFRDAKGDVALIYDMRPGTTYLFRPDQHVLARWRQCNANAVEAALRSTLCR